MSLKQKMFSNMKPIILCVIGVLGLLTKASAQEIMQFTFIGSVGGTHDTVILTSTKDLKMKDVEVRYMDQRTFETLKAYILRNWLEKRGKVAPPKNGTTDSFDAHRDIEVTGVNSTPLYFSKAAYFEIFYRPSRIS